MFKITASPISLDALAESVGCPEAGAVATFAGTTRAENRGRTVVKLEYEAYESMAVSEFEKIADELRARWEVCRVAIVHRVGIVPVGETSVAIAVSAPHRPAALEACRFAIDRLKHVAPIWKKEHFEGGEVWIGSLADCEHEHAGEPAGAPAHSATPSAAAPRSSETPRRAP
jgi:molybdopterin synthase catalytic subunit